MVMGLTESSLHAGGCSTIISHNSFRECPGGQRASSRYSGPTDGRRGPEAGTWPALSGNLWASGLVGEPWALQPPKSSGTTFPSATFQGANSGPLTPKPEDGPFTLFR